ncbi:hypothetical protein Egran_03037 [Elaphomyces granulatus]|uniref:Homeobox domain-containing protein n=1 Tax=Elaphomyces granulatus TaxID=519963 RepID=A0A232LYF3_9EURO|nr:hypothetical protein Egran_03037 [Elaphomyces granulatus]
MEYFDFDEASFASQAQEDDVASDCLEVDEVDAAANYESLFFDKTFELPTALSPGATQQWAEERAADSALGPLDGGNYPMFRAKEPCDFCKRTGLDCFIIQRGVLENGCTCCVSLYRECSFTHAKAPGKFLDTLHPVTEDVDIPTGGLTGKRALKSLGSTANFDDPEGRARKSGARFSREAVRILKAWLTEHSQHPYPTEEENDELQEQTGLKRIQVCNWLANARRRGKVRRATGAVSPHPAGVIPEPPPLGVDLSLMTPLERWKNSPPEHEAAATSAIIRAMANPPFEASSQRQSQPGHVRSLSRQTGSSNDSSYKSLFQTSSVTSAETENQSSVSDLSFTSVFSHQSPLGSFRSMDRKERRRRRKPSTPINVFNQQKVRSARIFQCTFCTDSFPAKYDWQRHEKSLHLALDKWTCAPQGGTITVNSRTFCAFCKEPSPDGYHLESHNYTACQEKTVQERTYYRKDHLNQHLRLMHNVKFHPWMDHWRSTTSEIQSRCGFCGRTFSTWKERVDHLAAHFKNGADMNQWQGDWGFEPFVQRLVENAIPPYLIGQERATLDPFKTASSLPSPGIGGSGDPASDNSQNLPIPEDANSFQRLQTELTAFIHRQVRAGIIPVDNVLQDEARKIVYGTDGPWNQTCADNPIWLSILKRDAGLETIPNSEHIQLENLGMQAPYAADGGLQHPPMETNPMARPIFKPLANNSDFQGANFLGSGFQSPNFNQVGFPSSAQSMPVSLAGSFSGSAGLLSSAHAPRPSSDWCSSVSASGLSSSTSITVPVDPLVQMGFDPNFLDELRDRYGELNHDDIEALNLEDFEVRGYGGQRNSGEGLDVTNQSLSMSGDISAPVSIPNSASAFEHTSEAGNSNPQHFAANSPYFGQSSFR